MKTDKVKRKPIFRIGRTDMHEMGIALQIIEIADSSIPEDMRPCKVDRVNILIGKMSAVVPDSLRFCFDIAAKGTLVEGAELLIEETPIIAQCKQCGHKWTIETAVFSCEKCQSGSIEMLSGRELDIKSIEIAQEE